MQTRILESMFCFRRPLWLICLNNYHSRFFLQIIGRCVTKVNEVALVFRSGDQSHNFLSQELSHFLMYITHKFQSGNNIEQLNF